MAAGPTGVARVGAVRESSRVQVNAEGALSGRQRSGSWWQARWSQKRSRRAPYGRPWQHAGHVPGLGRKGDAVSVAVADVPCHRRPEQRRR
jgi:hypothetical protein